MQSKGKDVPLEALRGLAAIVVVLWHCLLAFWPERSGIFPEFDAAPVWNGAWWFGLFNGNAAVTFFFVLSGFVLTRKYFREGDERTLVAAAVKRWPRLFGPVLLSVLASWALFATDAYSYRETSALTRSPWLADFAYAHAGKPFTPGLADAIWNGAAGAFLTGASGYNSSLWTMRYELIGSFMAFGLAALLVRLDSWPVAVKALAALSFAAVCGLFSPYYLAFPAGVLLAALLTSRTIAMPLPIGLAALMAAAYLAGYTDGRGDYALLKTLLPLPALPKLLHIAAGLLAIAVAVCCAPVRRTLEGRASKLLGEMSFPLYLMHIPMLCSAGCAVYLVAAATEWAAWAGALGAGATAAGTVLAGLLVREFDQGWIGLVNTLARRLAKPSHMWFTSRIAREPV